VMLSVVYLVKASRGWYESGVTAQATVKEAARP
jgi:hypothetical protein